MEIWQFHISDNQNKKNWHWGLGANLVITADDPPEATV